MAQILGQPCEFYLPGAGELYIGYPKAEMCEPEKYPAGEPIAAPDDSFDALGPADEGSLLRRGQSTPALAGSAVGGGFLDAGWALPGGYLQQAQRKLQRLQPAANMVELALAGQASEPARAPFRAQPSACACGLGRAQFQCAAFEDPTSARCRTIGGGAARPPAVDQEA